MMRSQPVPRIPYTDSVTRKREGLDGSLLAILIRLPGEHGKLHRLVGGWQGCLDVFPFGFEEAAEVEHLDLGLAPALPGSRWRDGAKHELRRHLVKRLFGLR
jgi:hypothetical protein